MKRSSKKVKCWQCGNLVIPDDIIVNSPTPNRISYRRASRRSFIRKSHSAVICLKESTSKKRFRKVKTRIAIIRQDNFRHGSLNKRVLNQHESQTQININKQIISNSSLVVRPRYGYCPICKARLKY